MVVRSLFSLTSSSPLDFPTHGTSASASVLTFRLRLSLPSIAFIPVPLLEVRKEQFPSMMTSTFISRSVAGEQEEDYDDSRRSACVKAISKQSQNKGYKEIDTAFPIPNTMILGQSKGLLIEKLSVTDEAAQKYQELCTTSESGTAYSGVSAVIDCQNEYNMTLISVLQNQGICYPAVSECEAYYKDSQGALDWWLDTKSLFDNRCTVRLDTMNQLPSDESILGLPEKGSEDYEMLLPMGEGVFQSFNDVNFSASRVKKCLDAFGAAMHLFDDDDEDDPVEVARQELKGLLQTTTIQETPVLVQLEHYDHDSDLASLGQIDTIVRNYSDRCHESGGHFSSFTGVLDCISTSDASKKTTTKVENESICFPAQGCEDYTTLLQWKLDIQRKYGMSCLLRDGTGKTEDVSGSSGGGQLRSGNDYSDQRLLGLYLVVAKQAKHQNLLK